jgi:hypothetical protein
MRMGEARDLGRMVAERLRNHAPSDAFRLLAPELMRRIPFRALDEIGLAIGVVDDRALTPFLDHIAASQGEGGWIVKGVGWGTKTMGRYYPQETADRRYEQVAKPQRKPLLSTTLAYMPPSHREEIFLRCGLGA